MPRHPRPERKIIAAPSHPYELRFFEADRLKTVQVDDLKVLEREYTLEFLRSPDVAVVDMRGDKPKPVLL